MLIPGWLITILTFPGVIVHEFAHALFCKLQGVTIVKVCFFRLGRRAGYVIHEQPDNIWQHILISIGPFIINTVTGPLIALPTFKCQLKPSIKYTLIWLGISIAMHSFPSTGDAKSLWKAMFSKGPSILSKLVALPLVIIIYIGAIGSFFWLDLIYGVATVMLLPRLLTYLIGHPSP